MTARVSRLFKRAIGRRVPPNAPPPLLPMSDEEERQWEELRRRREARQPLPQQEPSR